jgi:hypothetical protein
MRSGTFADVYQPSALGAGLFTQLKTDMNVAISSS